MRIHVLFFAGLKDLFGKESLTLSLPPGSTLKILLQEISRGRANAEKSLKSVLFAVNHEYSPVETVLKEEDEVALLPPLSGG